MREFVFEGEKGEKLGRYLGRVFPELGRGYLRELLKNKDIKINGARVSQDTPLFCGDKIAVYAQETRLQTIKTEIATETADIVVYRKPRGITTEEFAARVAASNKGVIVCHRLDTNTEGLLVFARNADVFELIKDAFKNNYIHKYYLARVVGNLKQEGMLNAFLVKDEVKGVVKILENKSEAAVPISTGVKPLQYDKLSNTTLVEIELITGKTHQIRAHLAYIRYPIVGDSKYGNYIFNRSAYKDKQMLSAFKISFSFPVGSPLFYLNKKEITLQPDFD
ncbi:MAG: RluA family pseudouridine synthase [Candidatus Moranbacteria bacterium]|nr:RluA family pseudouridine synthase [Candidatus Moranbacteria bacterium]